MEVELIIIIITVINSLEAFIEGSQEMFWVVSHTFFIPSPWGRHCHYPLIQQVYRGSKWLSKLFDLPLVVQGRDRIQTWAVWHQTYILKLSLNYLQMVMEIDHGADGALCSRRHIKIRRKGVPRHRYGRAHMPWKLWIQWLCTYVKRSIWPRTHAAVANESMRIERYWGRKTSSSILDPGKLCQTVPLKDS